MTVECLRRACAGHLNRVHFKNRYPSSLRKNERRSDRDVALLKTPPRESGDQFRAIEQIGLGRYVRPYYVEVIEEGNTPTQPGDTEMPMYHDNPRRSEPSRITHTVYKASNINGRFTHATSKAAAVLAANKIEGTAGMSEAYLVREYGWTFTRLTKAQARAVGL